MASFLTIHCDYRELRSGTPPENLVLNKEGDILNIRQGSRIAVAMRCRLHFPSTYSRQKADGSYTVGYGSPNSTNPREEFLKIDISPDGRLDIVRDSYATLPIFYGFSEGQFVLSNHYDEVVEALPTLTLHETGIMDALAPHIGRPRLWNEVDMLGCNETLAVDKSGPHKQLDAIRPWEVKSNASAADPHEFFARLDTAVEHTLQKYQAIECPFGAELSAGLDSSLLPLFVTAHYPDTRWYGFSMIGPGTTGITQTAKLKAIFERAPQAKLSLFNASDMTTAITDQFRLPGQHPICPLQFGVQSLAEQTASTWGREGVRTVFNGFGGDELFAYSSKVEHTSPAAKSFFGQLPDFFTDNAQHLMHELLARSGITAERHIPTLIAEQGAGNNAYIDENIWPVSPFLDPELFTYCQSLPWKFRKNKTILRMYYKYKEFPPILYNTIYQNEDLNGFYDSVMLQPAYAEVVESLAQHSIVAKLGYIDAARLLQIYRTAQTQKGAPLGTLSCISFWLPVEINLRLAIASGQWRS